MHLDLIGDKEFRRLRAEVRGRGGDAFRVARCGGKVLVAVDDPSLEEEDEKDRQGVVLPAPSARFVLLPEERENVASHIHLSGPSGVGKSTWCGEYCRAFKETCAELGTPGRVVVVSADPEDDPAIPADGVTCDERIQITPELGAVPLSDVASLAPRTLIVFDDVEGVGRDLQDALLTFRRACVERGRKLGISTISVYHRCAGGRATRDSLNEATCFVVFPRGGLSKNTRYALTEHAGLPPGFSTSLRRRHFGRAVAICTGHPRVVVGDRAAAIIA